MRWCRYNTNTHCIRINKEGIENNITFIQLSLVFNCSRLDFHLWPNTAATELIIKPSCTWKISLSRSAFLHLCSSRVKALSFFICLYAPSLCNVYLRKTEIWRNKKKKSIFTPTHTYLSRVSQTFLPSPVPGAMQKLYFRQQKQQPHRRPSSM